MGAQSAPAFDRRPVAAVADRAVVRAVAPVEVARRSADAGALMRSVAPVRTVPEGAVQRMAVTSPHDPAEREASAIGQAVARMPERATPAPVQTSGPAIQRVVQGDGLLRDGRPSGGLGTRIGQTAAGGRPLPEGVRRFMEPRFNADFGRVRVHTGAAAAALSAELRAEAFTVGRDVFFAEGRFQPDTQTGRELIAHELTHVLQQGGVDRAGSFVQPSASEPGTVQRQASGEPKSWLDELTEAGEQALEFGEAAGWKLVTLLAPQLEPVLRGGPVGVEAWIASRAAAAAEAAFNIVASPAKTVGGAAEQLAARFAPLAAAVQTAAGQIAQNDCSPLRSAAEKIAATATAMVEPIVAWLQPVVAKVKNFLDDAWTLIGAPIWDWIKRYAAEQWAQVQWLWDQVKTVAGWIWGKTAALRTLMGKAWIWLKNKLGIGEGPDGENGLLQWVQAKAEAAWATIKARLEPYRQQITAIAAAAGATLLLLSPAGPIVAIGAAIAGAVQGLGWIKANWGKGDAIVKARAWLQTTMIPALTAAGDKVMAAVSRAASAVSGVLLSIASGLSRAAAAVGSSILKAAAGVVGWLADQARRLADWATGGLAAVDAGLKAAIGRLRSFLGRVLAFLGEVGKAILDVWKIPALVAGKLWDVMPACIRDPVVDFLGPIILRQIELFQELAKDDDAWARTKKGVLKIIRLVFTNHDLMGALRATFDLILRVFNIPPDLLVAIKAKAIAAWDTVRKRPLAFIKNIVRSLGVGFRRLGENILTHLRYGVEGWLAGDLADKSITLPKDWGNPRELFNLALDVLGLSVEHMFELLAKRFDPAKIARLRLWYGRIARAVDWVAKSIDVNKSPAENTRGIIDQTKSFAGTILSGLAEWVAGRVAAELAMMAAAAAASAGLSEVLDIARRIYKALVSAVKYARRILDMVNQALDNVLAVASGAVEQVGIKVEEILHRGMPVVIGFLANQVGLGGVGQAIRDIVDKLRAKVDAAILWLIDKIQAGLEALIGTVKAGVAALLEWWKQKVPIGAGKDAHVLQFDGNEDTAELFVHSDRKPVREFVLTFDPQGRSAKAAQARKLIAQIEADQKSYRDKKANGRQQETDALAIRIGAATNDLGQMLSELINDSADGSRAHPYVLPFYPKRRAIAYRDVVVGPVVRDGTKIAQGDLAPLVGRSNTSARDDLIKQGKASAREIPASQSGSVHRLSARRQERLLSGNLVGLSPEFAELASGSVLAYTKGGKTAGGGLINAELKPYGFSPNSEYLDGDHVMEMQLGGPNELRNLWPLRASENRSSGATLAGTSVDVPGEGEVKLDRVGAKKETVYLLIKSVRESTN